MIYKINEKGEFCKKCFSADEKVKKGIYSIEVKKIGGKGKRGCEWIVSFSFFFFGFSRFSIPLVRLGRGQASERASAEPKLTKVGTCACYDNVWYESGKHAHCLKN
jgi:hypothetical protein